MLEVVEAVVTRLSEWRDETRWKGWPKEIVVRIRDEVLRKVLVGEDEEGEWKGQNLWKIDETRVAAEKGSRALCTKKGHEECFIIEVEFKEIWVFIEVDWQVGVNCTLEGELEEIWVFVEDMYGKEGADITRVMLEGESEGIWVLAEEMDGQEGADNMWFVLGGELEWTGVFEEVVSGEVGAGSVVLGENLERFWVFEEVDNGQVEPGACGT